MPRLGDVLQHVRRLLRRGASSVRTQYRSLHLLRERRLTVLALGNVLDTMSTTIFVPFLPTLAEKLGASPLVIGLIFSIPAVVGAVVNVPAGYLSDRLGRRHVIAAGTTASALPIVAIAFAWSPAVLVVLRSLDALLRAFVEPATTAYLGDSFAAEERGSAFGAYHTTGMIGAAAGPAVGGAIAAFGGIRSPFLVLGAGTLVGGLVLLAGLPPASGGPGSDGRATGNGARNTDGGETPRGVPALSRDSIGAFLSVPAVAFLLTVFVDEFGTAALSPSFPLLLEETVGRGPAYVGTTYSALAVAMLLFVPVGGRLADRVGRVRILMVANVGWCVVMAGLTVATSPVLPPALMFLGGVLSAFAAPALLALQYEIAPDGREATFSGFAGTAESVGRAAGPVFAGAVIGQWGVRPAVLGAGLSWLVTVPVLTLVRSRTADAPDS